METGQNCTDCISAKATVTRSGLKLDACKNCEKNNLKTSSRDEKVNRQIRQLYRKNNHHLNGFVKPKDLVRPNGFYKDRKSYVKATEATDDVTGSRNVAEDLVHCRWLHCDRRIEASDLMHHLREVHVDTQSSSEMFVCRWTGCKVYDKSSCSLSWLERHVLSHSGAKPFKCLFDGCGSRFTSHCALERHINTHFKHINHMQQKLSKSQSGETTPNRPTKRRKRKIKKPYKDVTGQDYFDGYTLDGIRLGLYRMEQTTGIDTNNSGPKPSATFQPTVICRRVEPSGQSKHLLHWSPENVIPDTWVTEHQLTRSPDVTLPIHQLPKASLPNLDPCLYRPHRFRRHRRK